MAETTLTTAHDHAYQAAVALQTKDYSVAANNSRSAAAEFAKTTKTTADSEALRILKLLEEQHERLARICQAKDAVPNADETAVPDSGLQSLSSPDGESIPTSPDNKVTPSNLRPITAAIAATRYGSQVRDSSPSLARDMASRRGIPQSRVPPSAAAQARARQLSPTSERNAEPGRAPRIPPSVMDSQASISTSPRTRKVDDDESFNRFYSNITTGAMSKLSSVLAFAGLPLTADDIQQDPAPELSASKRRVTASNDPDVKKIFSKGALDAIEDEHRQRGTLGHGFGPAESFYLVQPTGGTVSYAEMAKLQQAALDDDEGTFVDAPSSPIHKRVPSSSLPKRNTFGKAKTGEELELENTTLKATLELLNTRLAAFETHAQDASLQAVTESVASLKRPHRDMASANDLIRQLEQQLEKKVQEEEELRTTAAKQEKELRRWNKRFDALQASAKEKARAKRENAGEGQEKTKAV